MTDDAKIIIAKATQLPLADRESILEAMLASLRRDAPAEADQAWRDIIDERLAEVDAGGVTLVDFEEAVGELRRK